MAETAETLRDRSVRSGVKSLAADLGVNPALLYDILAGRCQHISYGRHNELRRRLGLPPAPVTIPASPCPTCHVVHGDGYDCHGARVQLVRRKARRRLQDMPPRELAWRIEHREEIA